MLGSHCLNWNPWSLEKQLQQCKISCALTHPAPSPLFSTSLRDVLRQWEQPSVPGRCPARARGSAHMAAGRAHTRTLCSLFPLCCSRESNNFFCASLVTNCCRQEQFKLLLNLYQASKGNDSEKHLHVCFSHCVQKNRTFLLYITRFKAWSVISISS